MFAVRNLVDLLRRNCEEGECGITHINGEQSEVTRSYRELFEGAQAVLGILQRRGLQKGDHLVCQVDDNELFLTVLWACLLGGIIAVPLSVGNNDEHRLKLFKVWQVLHRRYIIADQKTLGELNRYAVGAGLQNAMAEIFHHVVALEELARESGQPGEICQIAPDDLAFIQFSSGSTGDPKGVTLTHENLITNLFGMISGAALTGQDRFLSWMPLTHDMGLIGFHLLPLALNIDHFIMPTTLFIRRPTLWLSKANQHKTNVLSSPNFGYRYFLAHFKPESAVDWDLSHISLIFNGAEPISVELCNEFLGTLAPFGLKRTAMYTVYGLAEASLAVSFPPPGEEFVTMCVDRESLGTGQTVRLMSDLSHRNAVVLVDEGYPIPDCFVRIADQANNPMGDMVVGRILISGRNVTRGYYRNPEATAAAMSTGGWVDTGDLGFMRGGRLTVTGRAKDIIFISGQNYYPHDLERVGDQIEGLQLGKVVACGVPAEQAGSEEVILFVHYKQGVESFAPLAVRMRRLVSRQFGIGVRAIIPIREIPKTTSGKFQRYKLGEMYRAGKFAGTLAELNQWIEQQSALSAESPKTDTERALLTISREVLAAPDIGLHDNLSDYGATSVLLAQIQARIETLYPNKVTLSNIFAHPSVSSLAYYIEHGGTICLPEVTLPVEYIGDGRSPETVALRVTLEGDRYLTLRDVAAAEGLEPNVLLLAVFGYLLSEIGETCRVAVQTMIGPEPDRIVSVDLNLEQMDDFSTLFRMTAAQCNGEAAATAYRVQDLGKIRLSRSGRTIVPLFYSKTSLSAGGRLRDVYDFTLEADLQADRAICLCEFDGERLRKDQVGALLADYVQMLDSLLAQYPRNFVVGESQ